MNLFSEPSYQPSKLEQNLTNLFVWCFERLCGLLERVFRRKVDEVVERLEVYRDN